MEPLWSPAGATGGNQSQTVSRQKPQKQAKSVATGCHGLPSTFHGKEGVDGSSPSEGSAKAPQTGALCFGSICRFPNVGQVWSPLWSLQVENAVLESRVARPRAAQKRGPRFIARLGLSPFLLGVSPVTLCAHPASHLACGPNPRRLELGQALPCPLVRRVAARIEASEVAAAQLVERGGRGVAWVPAQKGRLRRLR